MIQCEWKIVKMVISNLKKLTAFWSHGCLHSQSITVLWNDFRVIFSLNPIWMGGMLACRMTYIMCLHSVDCERTLIIFDCANNLLKAKERHSLREVECARPKLIYFSNFQFFSFFSYVSVKMFEEMQMQSCNFLFSFWNCLGRAYRWAFSLVPMQQGLVRGRDQWKRDGLYKFGSFLVCLHDGGRAYNCET